MALPVVHHENYVAALPDDHRFPMSKFGLLGEILRTHNNSSAYTFHEPLENPLPWIRRTHGTSYLEDFRAGTLSEDHLRTIGLPWSEQLVERTITAVGGTLRTIDLALQSGLACNTAGGTHHAFPDRGSGFCILNDLAVGARRALDYHELERILILDLDVHQGNGTAAFFREEPRVTTVSIHCETNYPFNRTPGDHDVELPAGSNDHEYCSTLRTVLPDVLDEVDPELMLYDAGVDVHRGDRLGNLKLTDEGLGERDRLVLEFADQYDVPTAAVIGGGYDEDVHTLAERHAILHRSALEFIDR
jgi:acetoin utilization deacetylase AcuC-like enzyme